MNLWHFEGFNEINQGTLGWKIPRIHNSLYIQSLYLIEDTPKYTDTPHSYVKLPEGTHIPSGNLT